MVRTLQRTAERISRASEGGEAKRGTPNMRRRRIWAVGLAGLVLLAGAVLYLRHANSIVGPWTDAKGRRLPDGTSREGGFPLAIHTMTGHSHCGWDSIVFLHIAWPPGTVLRGPIGDDFLDGRFRQYVKDPDGDLGPFPETFDPDARLPPDARPSGFRRGPWELWISPSEAHRAIYVVRDGKAELWPRVIANHVIACA